MTKPRILTARQMNGLNGVRRGARRECDERAGSIRSRMIKMQCFEIITAGKADAAATDCAADLSISLALVAIFVVRQRLIGVLRLLGHDM